MKHGTQRKLALAIIAASLIFLFNQSPRNENDPFEAESERARGAAQTARESDGKTYETVIYTCRLADEEIPAVQISEVTDEQGNVAGTRARAAVRGGIAIEADGAPPAWDYKSIAARDGENLIEVAYAPEDAAGDREWVLTLADENTYLKKRVRDCTEVSDE
ncbi:MAG TPA: hypothetical protein VIL74_14120 [Pyrinomonadaceae bacterium]|jgi:hypothetical protein